MERIKSDLTVIGAGISGICAAIAAARHGVKVALINDRPVLGGNASSEIGVTIGGATGGGKGESASIYAKEGGIIEEIKLTVRKYGSSRPMMDAALLDLVGKEPNISLFLNTYAHEVKMDQDHIQSVMAIQLGSERKFIFESPTFIDATGDGTIGCKAGAEFRMGREGRNEYNERYAPEEADSYTMGDCLIFHSRDAGRKVVYERPGFAYDFRSMEFFKNIGKKGLFRDFYRRGNTFHTLWWLEYGGQLNTITDNEQIHYELKKLIYGLWDYIKNSGDFEDVDNLELDFVSPIAGKRESRRFLGEYVLTQNDICNKTEFPDAVAIGGWPMDVHACKGIYDDEPASDFYYVPGIYSIPFRCLYSRNVRNLMFAGRNISVSHIALGSTRIISTCGCTGQAVGTAGYLCSKYHVLPSQLISGTYLQELTETLQRDDQTLLGRKEAVNEDLIRDYEIKASSTKVFRNETSAGRLLLDKNLCLALPVKTERLDSLEIKVRNSSEEEQFLTAEIWGGNRMENYVPIDKMREVKILIPPKFDGWMPLPVESKKSEDGKVYLIFNQNDSLSLYYANTRLTGAVTFEPESEGLIFIGREHFHPKRLDENLCFRNVIPRQELYAVENVLNGYSRPYGLPNLWISEDGEPEKQQWIEIRYTVPKTLEEIQLVFNSRLETDVMEEDFPVICAYTLEITDWDGKKKTVPVKDNCLRLNRHPIRAEKIKSIRVTFEDVQNQGNYEVYSIKLY